MTILFPEDISATAVPPREWKFHSFLNVLFESRPDVIGRHSVLLCGKEIDFVLYRLCLDVEKAHRSVANMIEVMVLKYIKNMKQKGHVETGHSDKKNIVSVKTRKTS